MKYMGSKRAMLENGLGRLLDREMKSAGRFIDLFSGSAAVSTHVASRYAIEVHAFDLQYYSKVFAGAILQRDCVADDVTLWTAWHQRATGRHSKITDIPDPTKTSWKTVEECRGWCATQYDLPITRAYGGHYFSPKQAVWIDCFRATLPTRLPWRVLALAALLDAASRCVAAPGHTAQPFQPTRGAKRYLREAWQGDVVSRTRSSLAALSRLHSKKLGVAAVANANDVASTLRSTDLVFLDPPYSGVHYSRFYHVLETIARGSCGEVDGTGRYPPADDRPVSLFSMKSHAADALEDLLGSIADCGARAILTFPDHECSNGLSGEAVREICGEYFHVSEKLVDSNFSTLGGKRKNSELAGRGGRHFRNEMILLLRPRID
jgi:adenine-specific DNA-methyltransferase